MQLSNDPVDDIRDWATFSLGQMTDYDGPDLREALAARLTDTHDDTRMEGLCGLVVRNDPRGLGMVLKLMETGGDDLQSCVFSALRELGDTSLLPKLDRLRAGLTDPDNIDRDWLRSLDDAITALRHERPEY